MGAKINIAGQRYGKLVAICPTNKRSKDGGIIWSFRCDCGKVKDIPSNPVRTGLVKSCGCLHAPHRGTGTRLFDIWVDMRQRCNNSNNPDFYRYGGRGITVCKEWNESFISFRDWAMGNGYSSKLSIDRKNVNGNYEPSNCRWATPVQQARNTRRNRIVSINGISKLLCEWCLIYGISEESVYRRKREFGWDFEKAITTPHLRNRDYSKKWMEALWEGK